MIRLSRRGSNHTLSTERLELLNCNPLLLRRRVNVPHGHLNCRVTKERAQGWQIGTGRYHSSREGMAKIIKPEMAADLCSSGGGLVGFLYTADRLVDIARRREHKRSFDLYRFFDSSPEQRHNIIRHGDRPTRRFRLTERIENGFLFEVHVLDAYSKHLIWPHAGVEHDFRNVVEWLTCFGQVR